MKTMWKKEDAAGYQSTAKIVDGTLILSLPDAVNPIVWRMELGSVKSSALEVRERDGAHILALKTPKGDVHDIAPFDSREKAVRALMRVSSALQGSGGRGVQSMPFPPASNTNTAPSVGVYPAARGSTMKWLVALGAVLLAIALFAYLGASGAPQTGDALPADATATGTPGGAPGESGVPQSADEMLRGF